MKLAVLVAAFTTLLSLSAFAVTGWVAEDNNWYYYGTDGEKLSNQWKADGGRMFWLGDDSAMVRDSLVDDDKYYVGSDGARVTSQWVKLPATEDDGSGAEYRYYYAQSSGVLFKATDDAWMKKINGSYYGFDADGKMLFGYVKDKAMINDTEDAILDCEYYFGEWNDGKRTSGWYKYEAGLTKVEKDVAWFYFTSSGKYVNKEKQLINKKYYSFDEYGIMQTGWYASESDVLKKCYYDATNGDLKKSSWIRTTKSGVTDDEAWFYLDSNGCAVYNCTKYIKSKYYVFNANGIMKAGLVELVSKEDGSEDSISNNGGFKAAGLTDYTASKIRQEYSTNLYYFSGDATNDGSAKYGTLTIEFADDTYTMGFSKYTYKALHGVDTSNYVYDHGFLQKSGSTKYDVKFVYEGSNTGYYDLYFTDTNGKNVTKTGKYGDANSNYYIVNADLDEEEAYQKRETLKVQYYVADNSYKYFDSNGNEKWNSASSVATDILSVVKGTKDAEWFNEKYDKNLTDFVYNGQ